MTREEAIEVLNKMKYPQKVNKNGFVISNVDIENEALEMAIQALSQEPTRNIEKSNFSQNQYLLDTDSAYQIGYEQGHKDAEQKSGKWILTDDDFVYCSECEDSYYPRPIDASWYYCPHCGARMVEPRESEDKE